MPAVAAADITWSRGSMRVAPFYGHQGAAAPEAELALFNFTSEKQ
jgi:hypothetical protein